MNGKATKAEAFNSLVRAGVLVLLIMVVCFAYLWQLTHDRPVGTLEGAILGLVGAAFVWWFKSRDEKHAAERAPSSDPEVPLTPSGGPAK